MKRLLLRVAGLMVVFGALSVRTAQADSHFSVHVGVGIGVPVGPVVVTPRVPVGPAYPYRYGYPAYPAYYGPAPYPGYVWQPGYYVGYRWYPGAWVARRPVYAAPRYRYGYGHAHAYGYRGRH